jgi:hypothetical protein
MLTNCQFEHGPALPVVGHNLFKSSQLTSKRWGNKGKIEFEQNTMKAWQAG